MAVANQMRIAKAAALVSKPTLACQGDGVSAMIAALLSERTGASEDCHYFC